MLRYITYNQYHDSGIRYFYSACLLTVLADLERGKTMANYEYVEGVVTKYAIVPPGTFAVTVSIPYKGKPMSQKFEFDYASFAMLDVREGTRVRLRLNKDAPYLLQQWQFDRFLI
jgi:hypothetical protein